MKCVLSVFVVFFVTSCQSIAEVKKDIEVRLVEQTTMCRLNEKTIEFIADQRTRNRYFGNALSLTSANKNNQLNFQHFAYVIVSSGNRPTSGYRYEITNKYAQLVSNTLILPLKLKAPDKNFARPQVITTTCVLLSIDKSDLGPYINQSLKFKFKD